MAIINPSVNKVWVNGADQSGIITRIDNLDFTMGEQPTSGANSGSERRDFLRSDTKVSWTTLQDDNAMLAGKIDVDPFIWRMGDDLMLVTRGQLASNNWSRADDGSYTGSLELNQKGGTGNSERLWKPLGGYDQTFDDTCYLVQNGAVSSARWHDTRWTAISGRLLTVIVAVVEADDLWGVSAYATNGIEIRLNYTRNNVAPLSASSPRFTLTQENPVAVVTGTTNARFVGWEARSTLGSSSADWDKFKIVAGFADG